MADKLIEEFTQEDNLELEDIYPFITSEDEEQLFKDKLLENNDEELKDDRIKSSIEDNDNSNNFVYYSIDS